MEGTSKLIGGYTDTSKYAVYCQRMPLSGKSTISLYILTEFSMTYVLSGISIKLTEQHIHPQSRVIHSRTTYMTTFTYYSKKQPTNNTEHT